MCQLGTKARPWKILGAIAALFIAAGADTRAPAAHVLFVLEDSAGNPATNCPFTVKNLSAPLGYSGTTRSKEWIVTNSVNGTITISNLVTSTYLCELVQQYEISTWKICVPETNAVVNDSTIHCSSTIAGGGVAYSIDSADARFVLKSNGWSVSQILTGAVFKGSTVIFQHTNGAVAGYVATTDGTNVTWQPAPGAGGGEANVLGNSGTTNTTDRFGLPGTKTGVTLNLKTLSAGANVILTNQGTNIVIASTGGGSGNTYDVNQFGLNGGAVAIKSGAAITNPVITGASSSYDGGTVGVSSEVNLAQVTLTDHLWLKSSGGTNSIVPTDSGPALYSGRNSSTPLDARNPDDTGAILNYWTAERLFGALIPPVGMFSNRWAIDNWFDQPVIFNAGVTNLNLTASRLGGTDANKKWVSYSTDGFQFDTSGANLALKSGVRSTNENSFGTWTNNGTMDQKSNATFWATVAVGANISLDASAGSIQASSLSAGGAFLTASGLDMGVLPIFNVSWLKTTFETNTSSSISKAPLSLLGSTNGIWIPTNAADGRVFTSDPNGNGQWRDLPASPVSDTAFASSWNGVTTIAPSKNAVYDQLHLFDSDDDGKVDVLDQGTGLANTDSGGVLQSPITTSAGLATVISDETGSGGLVFANGPAFGSASVKTNLTVTTDLSSGSLTVTGMVRRIPLLVSSANTTNQIDPSLQSFYKWTNMVTNIVLQLTNLWEGTELNFYFTGGTNAGPNYTVTFAVPNPAGVNIHWGANSPTNGATSFTVTNNTRVTAYLGTVYETTSTNIEAYYQYLLK